MNCRKIYRPAAVLMLSAAIVGTTVTPAFAAQKNTQKEENVYVNLKEDGSVDGVYVVNAYDLKKDQKVLDYGDYTAGRCCTPWLWPQNRQNQYASFRSSPPAYFPLRCDPMPPPHRKIQSKPASESEFCPRPC